MLDVPVDRVQRRDREREPGDEADGERRQREREPGRVARRGHVDEAEHETIASITANATSWVATIESGTSWRGKRTLRIRFAFSSRLRAADWSDVAKKTHGGRPESRNSQ